MKTVVNKQTDVDVRVNQFDPESPIIKGKYADLLKLCVNFPPKEGFSVEEMERRVRILTPLRSAGDEIILEDADFELMKSLTEQFHWNMILPEVIEMKYHLREVAEQK